MANPRFLNIKVRSWVVDNCLTMIVKSITNYDNCEMENTSRALLSFNIVLEHGSTTILFEHPLSFFFVLCQFITQSLFYSHHSSCLQIDLQTSERREFFFKDHICKLSSQWTLPGTAGRQMREREREKERKPCLSISINLKHL